MTSRAGARPRFPDPAITLILALCLVTVHAAVAEEPPQPEPGTPASAPGRWERFPKGMLFPQLYADPRASRTHTALAAYRIEEDDFTAGLAGYSGEFGLFRRDGDAGKNAWQISLSGGVNALFDMDASSRDLMSADYQVGLPITWRRENLAIRLRYYHISSHQGDDFLENDDPVFALPVRDMSFEALEAMAAYTWKAWTFYGGATKMVARGETVRRWWLKGGIQGQGALGPKTRWRWIAGLDLHSWQETGWGLDITAKGGLELPGSKRPDRSLRFLLEYTHGHVPYYQFFDLELTSYGAGLEYVF